MNGSNDDLLMEHEVDGIREYDNPLPGWWVNLFWLSILFCFPYTLYYHGVEGRTIQDEHESDVADRATELIATFGKLENQLPTLQKYMVDPIGLAGAGAMFRGKCAQCHAADGGGGVGPNLSDDHYINVKKIEDIFKVIKDGVPLKGMPAWGTQLSDTQIVLLASYVAQLRGKPIKGAAPKGEVIPAWPDPVSIEEVPAPHAK